MASSGSPTTSTVNVNSNLETFLQCVTPFPPSRFLSKSCINNLNGLWQPADNSKDNAEYFFLGDLWDCYREWSAYGAGTPILLHSGETITQYYVPYLSAIQIYSNKDVAASRSPRSCTQALDFESDTWSDNSMSGEKLSRSFSDNSNSCQNWDSVLDDSSSDHDVSLLNSDRFGCLYLQHFETSPPYLRVPLFDKITELAQDHPGLLTLRNVDLFPASWIAVAWYPIYHIPAQRNEKDLATCFLTYHTLSSSFQDYRNDDDKHIDLAKVSECKSKEGGGGIPLTPFGLATYKLHGDLWFSPKSPDPETVKNLYSAASSWLKQLNIQHQDYNFFIYNSLL